MIKAFDSTNLKQLRNDIAAAFAAIQQKHGVSLSLGTISYDREGTKATTRLTMLAIGDATVASDPRAAAQAKAQAEFKRSASSFGLKAEQYGVTFKFGRETYKLVGLKPRSPRFPILATNLSNGTTYKLPETAILDLQSKEHKELFGLGPIFGTKTTTAPGMCSNDNAYDDNWKNIGKCNRPATTQRMDGFGNRARMQPFCAKCAQLIDEGNAEARAEARMS